VQKRKAIVMSENEVQVKSHPVMGGSATKYIMPGIIADKYVRYVAGTFDSGWIGLECKASIEKAIEDLRKYLRNERKAAKEPAHKLLANLKKK